MSDVQLVMYFIMSVLLSMISSAFAQSDSLLMKPPSMVQVTGYTDVFYCNDANRPKTQFRHPFLYNHNRHNQIELNQGYIKGALNMRRFRANLALHAGTYVQDNYADEPGILKYLYEANAGFSLHTKDKIWMDAGIMSSHLGFESSASIDNLTLTRSLAAENSPYYMAGIKLTFAPTAHWEIAGIMSNGWQRIQPVQGNTLPAIGTQVKYMPNTRYTLNWSTFTGTDDPDSTRRMRYFHNLFAQFQLHNKWTIILGLDYGIQQQHKNSRRYHNWFTPAMLIQYRITEKWASTIRAEYYQDRNGIMIPIDHINGFRTSGFSLNLDYAPRPHFIFRLEGRMLYSPGAIFSKENNRITHNFFITVSAAFRLQKGLGK